jgi:hypothetical protein
VVSTGDDELSPDERVRSARFEHATFEPRGQRRRLLLGRWRFRLPELEHVRKDDACCERNPIPRRWLERQTLRSLEGSLIEAVTSGRFDLHVTDVTIHADDQLDLDSTGKTLGERFWRKRGLGEILELGRHDDRSRFGLCADRRRKGCVYLLCNEVARRAD